LQRGSVRLTDAELLAIFCGRERLVNQRGFSRELLADFAFFESLLDADQERFCLGNVWVVPICTTPGCTGNGQATFKEVLQRAMP